MDFSASFTLANKMDQLVQDIMKYCIIAEENSCSYLHKDVEGFSQCIDHIYADMSFEYSRLYRANFSLDWKHEENPNQTMMKLIIDIISTGGELSKQYMSALNGKTKPQIINTLRYNALCLLSSCDRFFGFYTNVFLKKDINPLCG